MATVESANSIKMIADFFLLSVAWSLVLFSPIASSRLTGVGLIKLLSNTAIGALIISVVIQATTPSGMITGPTFLLKILSLLGLLSVTFYHRDDKTKSMWLVYGVLVLVLGYLLSALVAFDTLNSLFVFSAGLFLGVITYSMILGHWYLVVPKLSEAPLKRAALVTWLLLIIKMSWSGYSLYGHYDFFRENTSLGAGYAFNWLLLMMRVAFGYLVIAGMSIFNWKLLGLRSIQSSTGILYAMTFFVFTGELVSMYLFLNYGLYI